jgi:DEAD/DEAH box helicase domain-containing protein
MPADELQTIGFEIKFSEQVVTAMRANNSWTNDPNQYGSQWPQLRKMILERDAYRCQLCGLHGTSSNLHVHHKVPFRAFNNIQEANQPANLITLCPACHRIAEQNVKMRSGLGGLGYLFAQIAPLHLMCDHNDISYFIDPASKYNQKRPILIIYDLFPGGIGLSAALFEVAEQVLLNCKEVIENCACKDGCPACVGPAGENGDGGKQTALEIIKQMLINKD